MTLEATRKILLSGINALTISPAQKEVMSYLIATMDLTRRCSVEMRYIAKCVHRGECTTRRLLHKLRDNGLIEIVEKFDRKMQLPNDYIILFDPERHAALKKPEKKAKKNSDLDEKGHKELILDFLKYCAKGAGKCSPSLNEIANTLRMRRSRVQSILKKLEEVDGAIRRIAQVSASGIPLPNTYLLVGEMPLEDMVKELSEHSNNGAEKKNEEDREVMGQVCLHTALTSIEESVLNYLRGLSKIKGMAMPSIRKLVEHFNTKAWIIRSILRDLIAKGLLKRIPRKAKSGRTISNEYVLIKAQTSVNVEKSIPVERPAKPQTQVTPMPSQTSTQSFLNVHVKERAPQAMRDIDLTKREKKTLREIAKAVGDYTLREWGHLLAIAVGIAPGAIQKVIKSLEIKGCIVREATEKGRLGTRFVIAPCTSE